MSFFSLNNFIYKYLTKYVKSAIMLALEDSEC